MPAKKPATALSTESFDMTSVRSRTANRPPSNEKISYSRGSVASTAVTAAWFKVPTSSTSISMSFYKPRVKHGERLAKSALGRFWLCIRRPLHQQPNTKFHVVVSAVTRKSADECRNRVRIRVGAPLPSSALLEGFRQIQHFIQPFFFERLKRRDPQGRGHGCEEMVLGSCGDST